VTVVPIPSSVARFNKWTNKVTRHYVFAMTYGRDADWGKNVDAAGAL
jgi:hypothetical protein